MPKITINLINQAKVLTQHFIKIEMSYRVLSCDTQAALSHFQRKLKVAVILGPMKNLP